MELSERSRANLALGKKLVSEQGLEDSVDTLGRWMAHHIAELIQEAESACDDHRPTKMANAREAVLAFWAHRHALPSGRSPFAGVEPILEVLEGLDPDGSNYRYFSPSHAPSESDKESEEVYANVAMAKIVDRASKIVIDFYLAEAARGALDTSKEWVQLATEAGADDGLDITLIRMLTDREDLTNGSNPNGERRRLLNDRKLNMEALLAGASDALAGIKAQLAELPADVQDAQDDSEISLPTGGD
ncbi:AVAST type 3 anti-phage proein Avs3b [Pseudomonas sp. CCC3.1]|uniref:AVAST type 3 anti-phage proein Avs3b n=1 Tax=Pseudomonas sp. CCC3.1 TaxID=3048607 RepID=UPI002AC8F4B9|nr:AVAST type 3 anti-phage proein Avs3b [Pseudomonas sp. CCC3.1]MEB0207723.1 hypothetical protein [Pseudomonas sp. CCC3.1]WPX38856.1 AVAST type 3 anti-phage protein Avs3b [Pseudomonas sp. CCC3.1]